MNAKKMKKKTNLFFQEPSTFEFRRKKQMALKLFDFEE